MEAMKPTTMSIFELFEKEKRYVLPIFQRPYVWKREKQWEPLWEDVTAKADEVTYESDKNGRQLRNHFMGAVVLNQIKTFGQQIAASEVIDGQQRLTTLQIVLIALRDYAQQAGYTEQFEKKLSRITENTLGQENERYKVWPTSSDQATFEAVFSAKSPEELNAKFPLIKKKFTSRYEPRPNLVEAYLFFYESISKYVTGAVESEALEKSTATDRINALVDAVTRYLELVLIELEDRDDPQIIFETLNARGEPLLPSDLIRNFVFLDAARRKENVPSLYKQYWEDYDQAPPAGDGFWKMQERQGRLTRPRMDLFIFYYLTCQTENEIPITHLFQEFKDWWESRDLGVAHELQQLQQHSALFRELFTDDDTSRLHVFANRLRILDTSTLYPLLLFLLAEKGHQLSLKQRDDILTDLESYLVRRMVCCLTTKNYNRVFLTMLRTLKAAPELNREAVQAFLLSQEGDSGRWPGDEEFRRAWLALPAYQMIASRRIILVLKALDQAMKTAKQEDIHYNGPLTVEHIIPQSASLDNWPLPPAVLTGDEAAEAAQIERARLIHTFGNLTLLTQSLNSSISNGPFSQKRGAIAMQSVLRLNTYFQPFPDTSAWNEDNIRTRGEVLFRQAIHVWPYPAEIH